MATQTLTYCTDCELECTTFPAFALLCVPVSIVANPIFENSPSPLISIIQSVRASTCADPCGLGKFVYTIEYNDADLLPGYLLTQAYVHSIVCDGCLTSLLANLVNSLPTMIQEIVLQILSSYFLDTASVNFTTVGNNVEADVNISADLGNCIVENPDGLFAPCGAGAFLGSVSVDLNSGVIEQISINSSNYIVTNIIATNASAVINNAVIQIYADVGLTIPAVGGDMDISGGVLSSPLNIFDVSSSSFTSDFENNRRTETILYVDKIVQEGSPATVDVFIYGFKL